MKRSKILITVLKTIACGIMLLAVSESYAIVPQPGEDLRDVCAGIGTDVDTLLSSSTSILGTLNTCCVGTFTALAALNTLIVNDFDHTFTALARTQDLLSSKIDACCTVLINDFNATYTAIAALGKCDPIPLSQTNVVAGIITLGTTGLSYCLTQNITANIVITASDITVDLNEHALIGTIDISAASVNVTIKNGSVKPPSDGTDATHAALKVGANAEKTLITDCYIVCSDFTAATGVSARTGLDNGGNNTICTNCFIQTGSGNNLGVTGGNGGTGITSSGTNAQFMMCTIITGTGGAGSTTGGAGGTAIITSGANVQIMECTIQTSGGGNGAAGNGGAAGIGISSSSANGVILESTIATGPGGNGLAGNGGAGGAGINNTGAANINTLIEQCVITTGSGGSGGTTEPGGNGGAGGSGIINASTISNAYINECTITAGSGGAGGAGTVTLGGNGGSGGTGISDSGTNTQITFCTITTNAGGAGGVGVTTGGAGGSGGLGINSLGANGKIRNCSIKQTGNGGALGSGITPGTNGVGGDGIKISSSATNTNISSCIITNAGLDGSGIANGFGGLAIRDLTTVATEMIYSNFAFLIPNTTSSYILASGAAVDSPNGTAFGCLK